MQPVRNFRASSLSPKEEKNTPSGSTLLSSPNITLLTNSGRVPIWRQLRSNSESAVGTTDVPLMKTITMYENQSNTPANKNGKLPILQIKKKVWSGKTTRQRKIHNRIKIDNDNEYEKQKQQSIIQHKANTSASIATADKFRMNLEEEPPPTIIASCKAESIEAVKEGEMESSYNATIKGIDVQSNKVAVKRLSRRKQGMPPEHGKN